MRQQPLQWHPAFQAVMQIEMCIRDRAPTTYSILVGFALSNILMVFVGLAIARYVVNVTKIPNSILMPVVVSLALIGSYAINASMFDVFVAIFFGFLGYLMNKLDLSSAALILGLILGGTAESGLMLSLVRCV